ncbi:type IV secretory system conjugative DNA transfer family protein [Photobacterium damselae]|uniref:type IV secretory system conjugative DNA transfer family protein n=1 Tax=Photobacterium damselae TaxID=38293 RepID=UPI0040696323
MSSNNLFGYKEKKHKSHILQRIAITALLFISIIILSSAVTEYVAQQFGWQQFVLRNPFEWMIWAIRYAQYKALFQTAWLTFLAGSLLLTIIAFIAIVRLSYKKRPVGNKTSAGTASFATKEDIQSASLMTGQGVYVGGWEETPLTHKKNPIADAITLHYLRHNGPEHILCFAPTRSGKGVGLVLPTLLSWQSSAIILDIKGELYQETSNWRSTEGGNVVLLYDPARPESCGFNPLEEVRIAHPDNGQFTMTGYEVSDAQNIALMLANPEGKDKMDHFEKQAYSLIVALILHNRYKSAHTGEMASMADVGATLKDPNTLDIYAMFSKMMTFPHLNKNSEQQELAYSKEEMDELMTANKSDTHPVVLQIAADMYKKADRELASIISTASAAFNLFLDPIVAKNTCKSDFKIDQLRNDDKPISLYIVTRPTDIDRLKPLSRILFTLILKRSTETNDKPKHKLLMLMDEFTSMGRLQALEDSIAYVGGYGIKIYLIVQDTEQLFKHYTKQETIIGNCHIRIAYAPNKVETAELLSKMTGTMTVAEISTTVSGKQGSVTNNISYSINEKGRPLLTTDECMRLPAPKKDANGLILAPGKMLIFVAGFSPIFGTQILYFLDPVFRERHSSAGEHRKAPLVSSQVKLINPKNF